MYLSRCKKGAWKTENTEEALKVWNLERLIEADSFGQPAPETLTIDQLIGEVTPSQDDIEVVD